MKDNHTRTHSNKVEKEIKDFFEQENSEGEDLLTSNIMNDFPSICDLDPNEIFERKEIRNQAIEEALKSSVTFKDNTCTLFLTDMNDNKDSLCQNMNNKAEKYQMEEKRQQWSYKDSKLEEVDEDKRLAATNNETKCTIGQEIKGEKELKDNTICSKYEEVPTSDIGNRIRFSKKNDSGKLWLTNQLDHSKGLSELFL